MPVSRRQFVEALALGAGLLAGGKPLVSPGNRIGDAGRPSNRVSHRQSV